MNRVRVSIFGDIMSEEEQMEKSGERDTYRLGENFFDIARLLRKSDYNIGNLETPITDDTFSKTSERYCFSTPKDFAVALKKVGFHCLTTANNHCLDRGTAGLINTIENLDQCNLDHIGTYKTRTPSYMIKEINGIKVGIISFTYGTNAFHNDIYLEKMKSLWSIYSKIRN